MFHKVTHCAGGVSANTRSHQLRWDDQEMGTAISCTKCSQVAGLIQKLVETPRSSKAPSVHAAVLRAAVFVRRSCVTIVIIAGLIQKLVETPRSSKAPSVHAAVLRAAVFVRTPCVTIVIVDRHLYGLSIYRCINACMHTCAYGGAGGTGSTNG